MEPCWTNYSLKTTLPVDGWGGWLEILKINPIQIAELAIGRN